MLKCFTPRKGQDIPPREAVSQTPVNNPLYTRQWEHLRHTLKNTPFNPAHTARVQHCTVCIFSLKSNQEAVDAPSTAASNTCPQVFTTRLHGVWSNLSCGRCSWLWQGQEVETRLSFRSLSNINYSVILCLTQCFHIHSCSIIRHLVSHADEVLHFTVSHLPAHFSFYNQTLASLWFSKPVFDS